MTGAQDDIVYKCTYLTGTLELKQVEYEITEVPQPPKWFGMKAVPPLYYVDCIYSRLGPFDTRRKASDALTLIAGFRKNKT